MGPLGWDFTVWATSVGDLQLQLLTTSNPRLARAEIRLSDKTAPKERSPAKGMRKKRANSFLTSTPTTSAQPQAIAALARVGAAGISARPRAVACARRAQRAGAVVSSELGIESAVKHLQAYCNEIAVVRIPIFSGIRLSN
jgi:hypothetical protein